MDGLELLHDLRDQKWREKLEVIATTRKRHDFNDTFAREHHLRNVLTHGEDINGVVDVIQYILRWFPPAAVWLWLRKRLWTYHRGIRQLQRFAVAARQQRLELEEALYRFWVDCEHRRRTLPPAANAPLKGAKGRVHFDPAVHPTSEAVKRQMIHNMYLVKRRAYIRGYARYLERYGQLRAREVALAEQLRKWATAPLTCIITDPKEAMERLKKLSDEIYQHQKTVPVFRFDENTICFDEMVRRGARMGIAWVMKAEDPGPGPLVRSLSSRGDDFGVPESRSLGNLLRRRRSKSVSFGVEIPGDDEGDKPPQPLSLETPPSGHRQVGSPRHARRPGDDRDGVGPRQASRNVPAMRSQGPGPLATFGLAELSSPRHGAPRPEASSPRHAALPRPHTVGARAISQSPAKLQAEAGELSSPRHAAHRPEASSPRHGRRIGDPAEEAGPRPLPRQATVGARPAATSPADHPDPAGREEGGGPRQGSPVPARFALAGRETVTLYGPHNKPQVLRRKSFVQAGQGLPPRANTTIPRRSSTGVVGLDFGAAEGPGDACATFVTEGGGAPAEPDVAGRGRRRSSVAVPLPRQNSAQAGRLRRPNNARRESASADRVAQDDGRPRQKRRPQGLDIPAICVESFDGAGFAAAHPGSGTPPAALPGPLRTDGERPLTSPSQQHAKRGVHTSSAVHIGDAPARQSELPPRTVTFAAKSAEPGRSPPNARGPGAVSPTSAARESPAQAAEQPPRSVTFAPASEPGRSPKHSRARVAVAEDKGIVSIPAGQGPPGEAPAAEPGPGVGLTRADSNPSMLRAASFHSNASRGSVESHPRGGFLGAYTLGHSNGPEEADQRSVSSHGSHPDSAEEGPGPGLGPPVWADGRLSTDSGWTLSDASHQASAYPAGLDDWSGEHPLGGSEETPTHSAKRRDLHRALQHGRAEPSVPAFRLDETFLERITREAEERKQRDHMRRNSVAAKAHGPPAASGRSPKAAAEPAEAVMWDRFTFPTGLRDVPRHVYTYFPAYPAVPAGPVFCLNPYDLLRQEQPPPPAGRSLWKAGRAWVRQRAKPVEERRPELCPVRPSETHRRVLSSLKR